MRTLNHTGVRPGLLHIVFIALGMLPCLFAGEAFAVDENGGAWPTPEGLAFEAARHEAGKAYIDCARAKLNDDSRVTASALVRACNSEADTYARYLPLDRTDEILTRIATDVKGDR